MASRFVEKIESEGQRDVSMGADQVASDNASAEPKNTTTDSEMSSGFAEKQDTSTSADPIAIASDIPTTDILLIGRTGMGKSSTGNKLLQAVENVPDEWFETTRQLSKASVTANCKVLTNGTALLRIVDVPGFASTYTLRRKLTPYQANLRIMREILMIQAEDKLRFKRIVYFFPARGELARADATFQEELSVMHYFFGDAIFQNMILVATARERKSKKGELTEEDLDEFKDAYRCAYQEVVKGEVSKIPPVIYISLEDTPYEILEAIMTPEVGIRDGIQLTIADDVCAKCTIKLKVHNVHGKKTPLACSTSPSDADADADADADSKHLKLDDTQCHPAFVRKWSRAARNLGGTVCIATWGIAYLAGVPWFYDKTEICPKCNSKPGPEGCMKVGEKYVIILGTKSQITSKTEVTVRHINKVGNRYAEV